MQIRYTKHMTQKKVRLVKTPEQLVARQKKMELKQANAAKPLKINMSFENAIRKVVKSGKK